MPAPKNNTFAAKPAKEAASAQLQIRVNGAHKKNWKRAAGSNLSQWAIDTLNAAATKAGYPPKK